MVHGLFKIERHDLGTLGGDLLLTAWRRTEAKAIEETKQSYKSENYRHTDGSAVVVFMPKTLIHRHPHVPYSVSILILTTPHIVCLGGDAPRTSRKSAILGDPHASGGFYFDNFWISSSICFPAISRCQDISASFPGS